jgi:hypothetical protein
MAAATNTLNLQAQTANEAISEVKLAVAEFVGKSHPAALIAWFLVGAILLSCVGFTAWHNWNLFSRGADTDFGKGISVVPALLLDGSIILLLVLLLTYFKDALQWWIAVIFNAVLFIIVGVNTSLDYSLTANEALADGMRFYLRWGVLGSFLLAFAVWEILIHMDPKHRQRMARAKLEMQALTDAAAIELQLIELEIAKKKNDLNYKKRSVEKAHARRMAALEREEVTEAWDDFELAEASAEAAKIRNGHPKAQSRQ